MYAVFIELKKQAHLNTEPLALVKYIWICNHGIVQSNMVNQLPLHSSVKMFFKNIVFSSIIICYSQEYISMLLKVK
jgi:hypothetical protein